MQWRKYESLQNNNSNDDDDDDSFKSKNQKSVNDHFESSVCKDTCMNLCKTAKVTMMMIMVMMVMMMVMMIMMTMTMITPEARWFFAAGLHIHSCCHPSLNRQQN